MKKVIFLTVFLLLFLSFSANAQSVPTIQTKIIKSLSYNDAEIRKWERFEKLNEIISEKGNDNTFTSDDKKIFKSITQNTKGDADLIPSPWNLHAIGCSWYCGASYEVNVSSSLRPQGKNDYSKDRITDDNSRTAWVEGVKGYGVGEFIEFVFPYGAPRATKCNIVNGYYKNEQTWKNNSRVKTFNIYDNEKLIATVHLKDTRHVQQFKLPYPFPKRPNDFSFDPDTDDFDNPEPPIKLKFVITDIYKGDKYDDTAISEIYFDGIDVHCLAEGTIIDMADGSKKAIDKIKNGDKVKFFEIGSQNWKDATVKKTYKVTHSNLLKITSNSGSFIIATNDHPFLTPNGWQSFDPQKTKQYKRYTSLEIGKLKTSSMVNMNNGSNIESSSIISVEEINKPTNTYTLELDAEGAYVANGFLVGQE